MSFVPHTAHERATMLQAIGVESWTDLFASVPERARFPALRLPRAQSELEVEAALARLAHDNLAPSCVSSFLGAGTYRHYIPATVDYVLQRGELYTSYTPYQPELSQGVLQAMFEYQSMICALTAMEVSNASHYEGATALAEGVLMSLASDRRKVVVSSAVHPRYRAVLRTYLSGSEAMLVGDDDDGDRALHALLSLVDRETAALVVQSPDFFGRLVELRDVADAVHAAGALLIVLVDPIALGLFRPPGELGADVVVAEGQSLGIPPSFGGPNLGIFTTRTAHLRRLVGRVVGQTVDRQGERGYVLTLATREQHIRREKATSNICTNSNLMALAAGVYLSTLGKQGLRRVAELCYHKSHYAASSAAAIPGVELDHELRGASFFKEFVLRLPRSAAEINHKLLHDFGIIGGYDLGRDYPGRERQMLVAVTELTSRVEIDRFVAALKAVSS